MSKPSDNARRLWEGVLGDGAHLLHIYGVSHMTEINFFNNSGQVSLDLIDPIAEAALDPERRAALNHFCESHISRKETAEAYAAARDRVRAAMIDEAAKLAANLLANPPPSFMDIQKAAIHAFNGTKPEKIAKSSHSKIARVQPRIDHENSLLELASARDELSVATTTAKTAERVESAALVEWMRLSRPYATTPEQLIRDHVAKAADKRAQNVAAGHTPEHHVKQIANPSAIDQAALARGRRPSSPLRSAVTRR
jgi:hypothetical protein